MPDKSAGTEHTKDLASKVREWLSTEGYPLEFQAASILRRKKGFRVWQGMYVREHDKDIAREIDVLASMDCLVEDHLFRVYHVIECKYSKDKPWVVFSSSHSSITESACAAQSIGSEYGSTIMWAIAGDEMIKTMELFSSPRKPGFNGRQALSKGEDRFYNSMKSITDLSTLLVKEYDRQPRKRGTLPHVCVIAFPVILLDGQLFEAYFCDEDQETKIREVQHVRCHWRGSPTWRFHATIDIVTLDFFADFCDSRTEDTARLLRRVEEAHRQVETCFKDHSLDALTVESGSRGIVGLPPLLREALPKKQTKKPRKRA